MSKSADPSSGAPPFKAKRPPESVTRSCQTMSGWSLPQSPCHSSRCPLSSWAQEGTWWGTLFTLWLWDLRPGLCLSFLAWEMGTLEAAFAVSSQDWGASNEPGEGRKGERWEGGKGTGGKERGQEGGGRKGRGGGREIVWTPPPGRREGQVQHYYFRTRQSCRGLRNG